jgi:protein-S-isoprenylcysteine O-methyltransferase Ste14
MLYAPIEEDISDMVITVIDIVIHMYQQTTVPSRFAYIFWSMFFLIYLYTSYYERLHNLNLKKVRTYRRWNFPVTLYIFGTATIVVHHVSLEGRWANPLPGKPENWGLAGFTVMLLGLVLVCLSRAAINGYWGPNIYDYGKQNELVKCGVYAYTRHPLYDGQFLLAAGTVMMGNNFDVVFFPLAMLIINIFRAFREEKDLLERFRDEFVEYKNQRAFFMFFL